MCRGLLARSLILLLSSVLLGAMADLPDNVAELEQELQLEPEPEREAAGGAPGAPSNPWKAPRFPLKECFKGERRGHMKTVVGSFDPYLEAHAT